MLYATPTMIPHLFFLFSQSFFVGESLRRGCAVSDYEPLPNISLSLFLSFYTIKSDDLPPFLIVVLSLLVALCLDKRRPCRQTKD
jgi:hypothetical protein